MKERSVAEQVRQAVHQARARVYQVGKVTPLEKFSLPGEGPEVWVKREDLGPIKAYKWRGAFNAMACLTEEERARGIVAASAGNHAQGIALAAKHLGCRARIFMPEPTPQVKQDAVRTHGGEMVNIVLTGDRFSQAQERALEEVERTGEVFIPPYDSVPVMGGQGTLADEVVMQAEAPFDRVYLAIGGGGMASAVAVWLKSYWPEIRIIGVEGEAQASMKAALEHGEPWELDYVDLFCDGTAVTKVGTLTREICQEFLDEIITVSNGEVAQAIRAHWERLRVIPEPSGAMSLAGYLQDQEAGKVRARERVLTVLCGANMDFAKVADISHRAALGRSREEAWSFQIEEKNGSLVELLEQLPDGTTILDLQYGRVRGKKQKPVLTVGLSNETWPGFRKWAGTLGEEVSPFSVRYRVIPFTPALYAAPLYVEVEFPERAGALLAFMREVRPYASLCYFNYTYSGERVGRALLGLDFGSEDKRSAQQGKVFALAGRVVRSVQSVQL